MLSLAPQSKSKLPTTLVKKLLWTDKYEIT